MPRCMPRFMPCCYSRSVLINVLTQLCHLVVRTWTVTPGHMAHTHMQNTAQFLLHLQLTAAGVCLYLGASQCTRTQRVLAPYLVCLLYTSPSPRDRG